MNMLTPSVQVPPFWHGQLTHSSNSEGIGSIKQKVIRFKIRRKKKAKPYFYYSSAFMFIFLPLHHPLLFAARKNNSIENFGKINLSSKFTAQYLILPALDTNRQLGSKCKYCHLGMDHYHSRQKSEDKFGHFNGKIIRCRTKKKDKMCFYSLIFLMFISFPLHHPFLFDT